MTAIADPEPVQMTAKPISKPILLIVDDEAGPRESLRMVFKDRYHCVIATCGREGVEQARQHTVDAAILDIKMPDMTGIDVLQELKKIDPHMECVLLTGYETMDTARAAVRLGAADYLNKPFDVMAIRELIERCMARRQRTLAAEESLRALRRLNEDLSRGLSESNRAVTAGVLSAGVVHELNNPLTIIACYAELLEHDLASLQSQRQGNAAQIQHRLVAIQQAIARCEEIAQRFLKFARSTRRRDEAADVARIIEDAVSLIKAHPANRHVELTAVINEPGLRVQAHPVEIMQILINLGVNALQAMNGEGSLCITAERAGIVVPEACTFHSAMLDTARPLLKLSVADSGPGIARENVEKIFEPYFTTKQKGTGLGLSIVRELVAQYGGLIDVQGAVGVGTTFSVYLPLAV